MGRIVLWRVCNSILEVTKCKTNPTNTTAFISYATRDKRAAEDLYIFLETFRLPIQICEEYKVPESLSPIFRDVTGLGINELDEVLKQELAQSRFLIVVCSPESAKSAWVNREAEYFIELGKYNCIIPYIIAGQVGGGKSECYALYSTEYQTFRQYCGYSPLLSD